MSQIILEAHTISKSFRALVLSKVDFVIKEAETHVILGKSGEGKSTFLKILSGLTACDEGEVLFLGEKLDNPEEVLIAGYEELAYVAQDFDLLHNRTVLENLKDALLAFKDEYADSQINQLLKLLRLESIKSQKIERLSGGEKQRLAIARALATQPAVLLLDEPFTQLDFHTRQILLDAIKEVRNEFNTSIILVSHNLYEAFYLADIVHVLHNGAIIRSDSPQGIYQNPEYVAVASLLGQVNLLSVGVLGQWQDRLMGIWSEHVSIESSERMDVKHQIRLKLLASIFIGDNYLYQFQLSENTQLVVKSKDSTYKIGQDYVLIFPEEHLFDLKSC